MAHRPRSEPGLIMLPLRVLPALTRNEMANN